MNESRSIVDERVSRDHHGSATQPAPLLLAHDGIAVGRRGRRSGDPVPRLSKTGNVRPDAIAVAVDIPHRSQLLYRLPAPPPDPSAGRVAGRGWRTGVDATDRA